MCLVMLYLAQVTKNPYLNELELQLLVMKTDEHLWQKTSGTLYMENRETLQKFNEGILVLLEVDENKQILQIDNAKNWILDITALLTTVRDSRIPSLPCLPSLFCPRWIPKTLY
jgi:hypothetical protein